MKRNKHHKNGPERTCIGCRKRRQSKELVRFTHDGTQLRLGLRSGGRGAWLCSDSSEECFKRARSSNAIQRALRVDVTDVQLEQLSKALSGDQDRG